MSDVYFFSILGDLIVLHGVLVNLEEEWEALLFDPFHFGGCASILWRTQDGFNSGLDVFHPTEA